MSLPHLTVSDNKRFVINENGEPFFWLGDTGWLLFSKLDRNEADKYLSNRIENGFNVIQVMVLHQLELANIYGDSALIQGDISLPKITEGNSFENTNEYDVPIHRICFVLELKHKQLLWQNSELGYHLLPDRPLKMIVQRLEFREAELRLFVHPLGLLPSVTTNQE